MRDSLGDLLTLRPVARAPAALVLASPRGVPLTAMMAVERRKGKDKPVIRKALVELEGASFRAFAARRAAWRARTAFASPRRGLCSSTARARTW